jgi:hypothetical protein
VELLREEMRWVLRYLQWEKECWEKRGSEAAARMDSSMEKRAGLQAYAAKQAAMHAHMGIFFRSEMGLPLDEATTSTIASTLDEDDAGELDTLFAQGGFLLFCFLFATWHSY